jgi:hypothetical protein
MPESMLVLSNIANVLSVFHHYVISTDKPLLCKQSYDSLLYCPVNMGNLFSDLTSNNLKKISHFMVNATFSNHLIVNFPNFIIVYIDGSISPLSAGYAFYIPELHVSLTNSLPLLQLCAMPLSMS